MLSTNEIKVGTAFMFEGSPFIVQKMLGQKAGRQGITVKLRVKNIVTGGTQDLGLDAGEKFDDVDLVEKNVKLSYIDGDDFHFMDQETYEDVMLQRKTWETTLDTFLLMMTTMLQSHIMKESLLV